MISLDSLLKSRDITLPTKVCTVKAMLLPVVMYGCKSWIIKKAEHWGTDNFDLCWRGLLRVPWTAKSNQPILKEINPEYSLEWLILNLKLQYFRHLMWRANSLEKTMILGKTEDRRRGGRGWDGWMASLTEWPWIWAKSRRSWRTEESGMLQSVGWQRVGHDLATKQHQQWTD